MAESIEIERKRLENSILGINFEMIIYEGEPYFIGHEIASNLGFGNPRDALDRHVDSDDKMTLKELFSNRRESRRLQIFPKVHPELVIINELAVYALCLRSQLPSIRPFKKWVYNTIRDIRKGNLIPIQNLSLEDSPIEKIRSTLPQIPPFESKSERGERKGMNKAYKEGAEKSKDEDAARRGGLGGNRTQSDIRELKRFVRNAYFESKDIEEKDINSKVEFFEIMREESKKIVEKQNLLDFSED